MQHPSPTSQHQQLIDALAGEWRSEELVAAFPGGPLDQARQGQLSARPILGGRFVCTDYIQKRDGVVVFAGHGVYGWSQGCFTMQWFDSDADSGGEVVPGVWNGDTLVFTRIGSGRRGRYEYSFEQGGSYELRVLVGDEQMGWERVLVGRFRRGGA